MVMQQYLHQQRENLTNLSSEKNKTEIHSKIIRETQNGTSTQWEISRKKMKKHLLASAPGEEITELIDIEEMFNVFFYYVTESIVCTKG